MPNYTAKEGETLADIAMRECGLVSLDSILAIADNKALFETRPDRVLHDGDHMVLPECENGDRQERLEEGLINEFETDRPEGNFIFHVLDNARKPRAGVIYKLYLDDGREIAGKTTGDGKVEVGLPYGETIVTIQIEKTSRTLWIGGLKSSLSVEGIQARLNNLGYEAGLVDGQGGDATTAAIRRFQKDNGLQETGEIDDALWKKLREAYGE